MGLSAGKSYSAKDVKAGLEALGFTVTRCEPTDGNFLVAASKGGRASTASCKLDGQKCKVQGLVGAHGLAELSKSAMEGQ